MHVKAGYGVVWLLLLALAGVILPAAAQDHEVRLTLERTACFGTCPMYTVTIYADGTVAYEGERFVEVTGTQTTMIDPAVVEKLVRIFDDAGYFSWEDEYTQQNVTDLPSVITSVTRDGETKRIVRYAGDDSAPLALPFLENWLDRIAGTAQWTGAGPSLPFFMSGGSPVISLERQPCFGMCPVYELVLYEDGTVVYLGFDHVKEVGVRITQGDAQAVTALANEMKIMGYFDWADAYTHRIVTDHATVITSLSWEGQFKRIERYDGDPDAPVGLVRIEDKIDRLADVSQWVVMP
ncbi:MAG: DUF6438 domain-containing protein [Anaerolineae bacterium]|nr:DUF6438 domain-containing protein [Anaerolineae bacterium]